MMPIFFPYTYISNQVAEAVAACFGGFTVYQPLAGRLPLSMQSGVDGGVVNIRIPVQGNDRELEAAAENYLNWADLTIGNTGINPASLKTANSSASLLDRSLSSHIVAEVKKQVASTAGDSSSHPVLAARMFLYFAQKFDQQSAELDAVLEEFDKKEQDLIQHIKVEDDDLAAELKKESGNMPHLNADYLIKERLAAWTRILLEDRSPPELFVTHRPAVVAHLRDAALAFEELLDIEAIPQLAQTDGLPAPWQDKLRSYLYEIIYNKWNTTSAEKMPDLDLPAAENTGALKIYLVPNQNAPQLFCRATGMKEPGPHQTTPWTEAINTLVCLVEP